MLGNANNNYVTLGAKPFVFFCKFHFVSPVD